MGAHFRFRWPVAVPNTFKLDGKSSYIIVQSDEINENIPTCVVSCLSGVGLIGCIAGCRFFPSAGGQRVIQSAGWSG